MPPPTAPACRSPPVPAPPGRYGGPSSPGRGGALLDLRIDISPLRDPAGEVIGWVNVCHRTGAEQAARNHMAQRARVVRKLGDVVADMTAQRDLEAVLDRIAASLCELTGADA